MFKKRTESTIAWQAMTAHERRLAVSRSYILAAANDTTGDSAEILRNANYHLQSILTDYASCLEIKLYDTLFLH